MIKKLSIIFAVALLFVTVTKAQWENLGAWPDTSFKGQTHSLAVDPDGKVWVSNYASDTTIIHGTDTLRNLRSVKIFNPDGTPTSFSPIVFIQGPGINDTLGYNRLSKSAPTIGMRADHNGNILLVTGTRLAGPPADATNIMYRFDYKTGQAMNKVVLDIGVSGHTTVVAPAVDAAGNIFVGPVFGTNPIVLFDPDFNSLGNVIEATPAFARSLEVSADGNTIYFPGYSTKQIYIYSRGSEFDPFALTDSIPGPATESISWNPATGHLWFSGGSYNDLPRPETPEYTPNTWYGYDVATKTIIDSLKWVFTVENAGAERPRALAFSPDGNTAYIGCFGGGGYPLLQKVVRFVGVREDPTALVNEYSLSQNYPNPFNPSTDIKFTVLESGFVTLKVYDVLGREVATLVNEQLSSGGYTATFNASDLTSGTYVYRLTSGNVQITKKMMLLK